MRTKKAPREEREGGAHPSKMGTKGDPPLAFAPKFLDSPILTPFS